MKKMKKEIFNDFLNHISDYGYTYSLYAKKVPISNNDEILLYDELYDIPDEIDGFMYVIGIDHIEQVLENLSFQIQNPIMEDYIEAINYYIENDAFIDKENPDNKPQGGYKIWGMAGTSDKPNI